MPATHLTINLQGDLFDVFVDLQDKTHLWFVSAPALAQSELMRLQVHYWQAAIEQYYDKNVYNFSISTEIFFSTVAFQITFHGSPDIVD